MGTRRCSGVAAAIALVGAAACNALTSVGDYRYDGACDQDVDCDDKNPCTLDVCFERLCTHDPQAAPPVVPGNCREERCVAGKLLQEKDPNDYDDGDPCTDDSCSVDGVAAHTYKASGDGCMVGALEGTCHAGACEIQCESSMSCDQPDLCIAGSCTKLTCTFTQSDAGAPCGDGGSCNGAGVCE